MTTKISGVQIQEFTIETNQLSNTATAAFAQSLAPKITSVNVANSTFSVLDDTAVNIGGGYIVITGSDFQSGASVLIDGTSATAVTYINTSTLHVQVPTKSAATYNLYVVNPDGGTGIRVNGVTYSGVPTWVTASPLANWAANVATSVAFNATGATSYSNTTTLPAGTQLLSNGYFYGTITVGAETQYTFTVRATDAENQDADKSFSVTVTVGPPSFYLWVSGSNSFTQQARGASGATVSSPVQASSTLWKKMDMYKWHGVAIRNSDDGLFTWGKNDEGQLGLNTGAAGGDRNSPTQVGTSTWSEVAAGARFSLGIKTDGTLWAWGANFGYGTLGIDSAGSYRSSPVQVGSGTNWDLISSGEYHSLAIKTDGTLWSWGHNNRGHLGINNTILKSSPTQVGTETNWSFVSAAHGPLSVGIKTNGTLWTWGYNDRGQLGQGDTTHRSSPTQVGTSTDWLKASVSYNTVLAIKTNGTLWSWGGGSFGKLGNNGTSDVNSPIQIGSSTNWSAIGGGYHESGGVKTDGTIWTWGYNSSGQLGHNDTANRSSPTQVGTGTNWTDITVGSEITWFKSLT